MGKKKTTFPDNFFVTVFKEVKIKIFETFQKYFLGKLFPNVVFFQRKKVPKLKTKKFILRIA